jgi:hypothetical protein
MNAFQRLSLVVCLAFVAQTARAQNYGHDSSYSYLSGESYHPYAYQRHVPGRSPDYGYQFPANSYAYPYNNGEHYSSHTYGYSQGYQDR